MAWVLGINQYRGGRGADRQHWLSLWNGAEIIVNRKTRQEVTVVPNPFVGVTGCLPPEVLPDLADPHRRADGLLDRILLSFPEAVPWRWTDASVTEATMAGYTQVLAGLWQLERSSGPEVGHGARPVAVTLTSAGRADFVRFTNDLYAQLADPALADHLWGPYAKLEGYAARLTLIIHAARFIAGETVYEDVDAQSVRAAIALVDYVKAHAKRVYARLGVPGRSAGGDGDPVDSDPSRRVHRT
jgi:hypothetical protein